MLSRTVLSQHTISNFVRHQKISIRDGCCIQLVQFHIIYIVVSKFGGLCRVPFIRPLYTHILLDSSYIQMIDGAPQQFVTVESNQPTVVQMLLSIIALSLIHIIRTRPSVYILWRSCQFNLDRLYWCCMFTDHQACLGVFILLGVLCNIPCLSHHRVFRACCTLNLIFQACSLIACVRFKSLGFRYGSYNL